MRGKGPKLGEPCPKVRLSQDRMPIVGVFYCIVYEVVYIIRVSTATFRILYIGSLYEVVYIIPVTSYTSIRLYEYPPHRINTLLRKKINQY